MAANVLKSTGGGRPKMGQAVRKSTRGTRLGESTSGKEPGRQQAAKAVDLFPAKTSCKEHGRQRATKAVDQKPAKTSGKKLGRQPATTAVDQKPANSSGKKRGRQPATTAVDQKPAKTSGKERGRQPATKATMPATKAADPKPAKMRRNEPGRQPATKAPDPKLAGMSRKESGREPATKAADAKKLAKTARKPSGCQEPGVKVARPTYWVMVKEAISSLKQRRGSSQQALAKYLEENYGEGLPENFGKILSRRLKEWSKADGQLTKVKNSYKLK